MKKHYIIGIDEAGRGPWAGPVVAGGWMAESSHALSLLESLRGLTDSKKVKPEIREQLFHAIEKMQDENRSQYSFAYRDAHTIDEIGIREANKQCMEDVILSLLQFTGDGDMIEIFIDGCDNYIFDTLEAEYIFARKSTKVNKKVSKEQDFPLPTETVLSRNDGSDRSLENKVIISYHIQGDILFPQISAASIIAKVLRDRIMCEYSEDFPEYGFHLHKGYGTRTHSEMMINYGITPIHRKSYAPVKALISSDS